MGRLRAAFCIKPVANPRHTAWMCIPRFAGEGTRAGPSHMANAADRESFSGSPLAARRTSAAVHEAGDRARGFGLTTVLSCLAWPAQRPDKRRPPREDKMSTYVMLVHFTDQGIKNVKKTAQRAEEFTGRRCGRGVACFRCWRAPS